MADFNLGKTYTFETLAPSLLGATKKRVRLAGIIDYQNALQHGNVELMYRNIFPLLPNGTVDDSKGSVYYLFEPESESLEKFILSEQWIDNNTIVEVVTVTHRITVRNSNIQELNAVRNVLNSLGISDYVVETI